MATTTAFKIKFRDWVDFRLERAYLKEDGWVLKLTSGDGENEVTLIVPDEAMGAFVDILHRQWHQYKEQP